MQGDSIAGFISIFNERSVEICDRLEQRRNTHSNITSHIVWRPSHYGRIPYLADSIHDDPEIDKTDVLTGYTMIWQKQFDITRSRGLSCYKDGISLLASS